MVVPSQTFVDPRTVTTPELGPMIGMTAEEFKVLLDKFNDLFVEALRRGKCIKNKNNFVYLRDIVEQFRDHHRLEVHEILSKDIIKYIHTKVVPEVYAKKTDDSFLKKLLGCYAHYKNGMETICGVLVHITDYFLTSYNLDPIGHLFRNIWREHVIEYRNNSNAKRLRTIMLKITADWRKGEVDDDAKLDLREACQMLREVGYYGSRALFERLFANPFIVQTADFYRAQGQIYLSMNESADAYTARVNSKMEEEEEFVNKFIDRRNSYTKDKVRHVMEIELMTKHGKTIPKSEAKKP